VQLLASNLLRGLAIVCPGYWSTVQDTDQHYSRGVARAVCSWAEVEAVCDVRTEAGMVMID
jgi:hypothetical protein